MSDIKEKLVLFLILLKYIKHIFFHIWCMLNDWLKDKIVCLLDM